MTERGRTAAETNVESLLSQIVNRVQDVAGVEAIVLGGSRARGSGTLTSDIDLGIYYRPEHPIDLDALDRTAADLDDTHRLGLLTAIGGWGPWINGGGWLRIQDISVDFLYRDLNKVATVIDTCQNGQIEVAYQPGHPHCFISSIYMGEVAICRLLWDPNDSLARLKAQTASYPPALKDALIKRFAWEAYFSIQIAYKSIARGDVTYAAGCCFRSVACMLQTLFAINEHYWLNEKGSLALAATFDQKPPDLQPRVEAAFSYLQGEPEAIARAIALLEQVVHQTALLTASL